ncbi:MAG TPA: type II secretion system protein [Syntrophomonadaceae bacterium]|nr:type II secretion system protein [Syntrophomonadaceae bacterium]
MMSKNERGFTLVEILVAILILGLVVTGSFNLLTHSAVWIFNAGSKGEALYDAQGLMENKILSDTADYSDEVSITSKDNSFKIDSKTLIVDYPYQDHSVKLTYIAPKQDGAEG